MNAFFTELAKKLADRWMTLLVLPGLLFLAASAVGGTLRHRHWNDTHRLITAAQQLTDTLNRQGPVAIGLALLTVLLGAATAGLVARGIAQAVQQLWLGQWPPPHRIPTRWIVTRRRERWQRLQDEYATEINASGASSEQAAAVAIARNRIALARPSRANWMGDRIAAVETRVRGQYGLDLASAWPRLWLITSDTTRTELRLAHEQLQNSTTTAAWGITYILVGAWWWPAALVGSGMVLVGWRTGRASTAGFAELLEAAVDVHGRELASALGVTADEWPLAASIGEEITRIVRKGA